LGTKRKGGLLEVWKVLRFLTGRNDQGYAIKRKEQKEKELVRGHSEGISGHKTKVTLGSEPRGGT